MGQVLSNIFQCICGESITTSGALLQTPLSSSPSSDSCSDFSTSGSSVYLSSSDIHGDSNTSSALLLILLVRQQWLNSHVDSSTTSALHHKSVIFQQGWDSHRHLGIACVLQQDPPLGVNSHVQVVGKKTQLALSHTNSIKPRGKERDRAEEKVKERWIKHYSSHQNILCVEAEDDKERLSHNLLLPPPTPASQINESNTNPGAFGSSPSPDSCSDLSTSGSSVHSDLSTSGSPVHLSILDSLGDSTTSSALDQNSHGHLGTACASQQEILISSESLESLGDSSTSGLLQLPMVFYSSTDILSNSTTYVPTFNPPLGVDSNIEVVEKKRQLAIPPLSHINSIEPSGKERERAEEKVSKGVVIKERWTKPLSSSPSSDSCSDLSASGSSVHLSSLDSHGDSITSSALHQNSHGDLQQEILCNSSTYVPTLDPPLGVDSNIEVVEKKRQFAIPPLSHINSIKPGGKERDREEERVSKGVVIKERWIKHYSSHQNILLLGEGDFSFSACLALAFGSANNMIATSLNSEGFLRKNYRNARSNIEKLRSRGSKVMHGVDATKMANDLLLKGMEFDRIIFNFPLSGFFENESRKSQLGRYIVLVYRFLANAKKMITEKGEIHISHKSNGFFLEWNVEFLASQAGLGLIEAVDFNLNDYPGYSTKYGFGGDKNFNCRPSKTYKFGLKKQPKVESKWL